MKKVLLIITTILFVLNSFSQKNIVKFSGKITNKNSENLIVSNETGYTKTITVNEDGSFSDTLNIPETGMYSFYDGRESAVFYLKSGYDLNLTLNTKEFDETIKYTGIGFENNNFLAEKFMINENELADSKQIYSLNEKEFVEKQKSVQQKYFSMLDKLSDKQFVEKQKKEINYEYLISLSFYESYHRYFSKDNNFKASKDFLKPLENLDYTNEEDYKSNKFYKLLVNSHFLADINNPEEMDKTLLSIKEIKSKTIKDGVINFMMSSNFDIRNKHLTELYNAIKKNCTDDFYLESFKEQYEALEKLLKGNESPKFSYKDIDGKQVSLDDFKGKFVYIDVWATWCSPCRGEIPFLKKMEKDYHGKDIVFVSISVDAKRDYDKWAKIVKDEELKGYQLFADKSWKSDFVQAYKINGIPTFILIDKEGKIISASAKRPSNPELRIQLDELLK